MAISKSAKIQAEIEKVTAKINDQQARLKELEQKKLLRSSSPVLRANMFRSAKRFAVSAKLSKASMMTCPNPPSSLSARLMKRLKKQKIRTYNVSGT